MNASVTEQFPSFFSYARKPPLLPQNLMPAGTNRCLGMRERCRTERLPPAYAALGMKRGLANLSPVPDSLSHLREEQDAISRTAKTGVYPYAALSSSPP